MQGVGKRTIRLPARFALSPTENADWHSTPTELSEKLHNELLDVSRQIEKLKTSLALQDVDPEVAEARNTPLPSPRDDDVGSPRMRCPEALAPNAQDGRHHRQQRPLPGDRRSISSAQHDFPTLREVRAFQQLHKKPAEIPQSTRGFRAGDRASNAVPIADKHSHMGNTQHHESEIQPQGKKLTSGLTRKSHDRVVREVAWPHEFVFSATAAVTHENLTIDQLVAGEMAIILSQQTNHMESTNRGHILRGLMLDLPTYTFAGIKNFYKVLFIHVEHGMLLIDSSSTLSEVNKLKEDHLRRPTCDSRTSNVMQDDATSAGQSGHRRSTYYCSRFQANTCQFTADHVAASGILHIHACKYCARLRPDVNADHPAKNCPHKRDRGRGDNHFAARDNLA